MKSRLVAGVVVLAAFVCGYAAGGSGLQAQAPGIAFVFGGGDTVHLRLAGRPIDEQCVVEGFASGFVACKGEQVVAYNLAQVISARVTARAQR
jgi:hypothetical protein